MIPPTRQKSAGAGGNTGCVSGRRSVPTVTIATHEKNVGDKLATLSAAPRPFLSPLPTPRDAGGVCTRVAVGPSGPAATSPLSSVGSVLHDAAPGQEGRCNLSMNGKSRNTNNRLLGRNGSN